MTYVKQTWVDNVTPVDAAHMNHMEDALGRLDGGSDVVFPPAPTDGQEFVFIADGPNGVLWQFRYYLVGGYWAFVGGPPLVAVVAASENRASAVYGALTTPGPTLTLPFAGDYDVGLSCSLTCAQNEVARMSYDIGATPALDTDAVGLAAPAAGGAVANPDSRSFRQVKRGLAAVTLTAKYRSGGGAASFANRQIFVTPIKH